MVKLTTPAANLGWQLQNFSLPDVAQNKNISIADLMGQNGLLVALICNHCPYVKEIISGFTKDAKTLQSAGVGVVAIMSNDFAAYPDDSPEKMLEFAKKNNFTFPYLIDETQEVAKAYGAVCTPDFFGFNNQGKLQYRGCFINKITGNHDLLSAMLEIAKTAKTTIDQIPSMGCSIKWK